MNDTGIRNLAIARGTPTLGIFPRGILFGYVPRFGLHDVTYTTENSFPEVDDAYTTFTNLLQRIEAAGTN